MSKHIMIGNGDSAMKKTRMNYSLAALMSMPGVAARMRRMFSGAAYQQKPRAKLIRIESITPCGHHAWCESNVGLIRKPLASVPDEMIAEFNLAQIGKRLGEMNPITITERTS